MSLPFLAVCIENCLFRHFRQQLLFSPESKEGPDRRSARPYWSMECPFIQDRFCSDTCDLDIFLALIFSLGRLRGSYFRVRLTVISQIKSLTVSQLVGGSAHWAGSRQRSWLSRCLSLTHWSFFLHQQATSLLTEITFWFSHFFTFWLVLGN